VCYKFLQGCERDFAEICAYISTSAKACRALNIYYKGHYYSVVL